MTVSMRVMSAGDGYKYLLKSVAAGDRDRSLSTPLTRYYTEAGTPPGYWMGSGLGRLGHGELVGGAPVSEAQLQLLIGMGHDPITGDPLGRAYQQFASVAERIGQRVNALNSELGPAARAQEVAAIEAEEAERGTRRAVAGYDFTFSVPKSVSAIWAVADAGTQTLIAHAHHAAVAELVAFLEREVAATRVGATGPDGAVAHVDVAGVAAAAFDHYDSRSGDPQLHTHVVISNKVLTVQDGRWRTLAGRPMHSAVVAVSELYNAALADRLAGTLGVEWATRERGRDRNPAWEVEGVPDELVGEFSIRSRHIEAEKDRLIAEYVARHDRQPSARTVLKLRAQATLATRPDRSCAASTVRVRVTAADSSWLADDDTLVTITPTAASKLSAKRCSSALRALLATLVWFSRSAASCSARAMARCLNSSTAAAISPTSSRRPRPGSTTAKSPPASWRIAAHIATIGREIPAPSIIASDAPSSRPPMPRTVTNQPVVRAAVADSPASASCRASSPSLMALASWVIALAASPILACNWSISAVLSTNVANVAR